MNRILILSVLVILFLTFNSTTFAATMSPVKGGKLPIISLPIPKNSYEKIYLGLSGEGFFKISQIKAKGVLIRFLTFIVLSAKVLHQLWQNYIVKLKIIQPLRTK